MRAFLFLCLVLCVVFIFHNSLEGEDESDARSGEWVEWLGSHTGSLGVYLDNDVVRKLAHFAEFTLLGVLAVLCLRVIARRVLPHLGWPLLLGLVTALADETLQLFVPNRTGLLPDVWIDFGGVFVGCWIGVLITRLGRRFWARVSLSKG